MSKLKKLTVIFKENNDDLFEWLKKTAKEEDISMNSFIIRLLKKMMKGESIPQPFVINPAFPLYPSTPYSPPLVQPCNPDTTAPLTNPWTVMSSNDKTDGK